MLCSPTGRLYYKVSDEKNKWVKLNEEMTLHSGGWFVSTKPLGPNAMIPDPDGETHWCKGIEYPCYVMSEGMKTIYPDKYEDGSPRLWINSDRPKPPTYDPLGRKSSRGQKWLEKPTDDQLLERSKQAHWGRLNDAMENEKDPKKREATKKKRELKKSQDTSSKRSSTGTTFKAISIMNTLPTGYLLHC